jgi:hypothetical protein
MQSSPAALITTIRDVRNEQRHAFAELGGEGSSLHQLRQMENTANQFRQLYSDLEMTVPQPNPSEYPPDYRVRLLRRIQKFSGSHHDSNLRRLHHSGGLSGIDSVIIQEAQAVANDRTRGSFRNPGALREIHRSDAGGSKYVDYFGDPLSWMRQFQPKMNVRVERITPPPSITLRNP